MSWRSKLAVAGFTAALAACGGSGNGSLTVSAATAPAGPESGSGSTVGTLDAGNGILIDSIRLVVRKIEVEGPTAGCTPATPPAQAPMAKDGGDDGGGSGGRSGDDSDDEQCEIEVGPFLVELSGAELASGIHPVFDASVPAGTYHEISLRIDTISAEKAARAPIESQRAALGELAARGVSLEVEGSKDGTPFTFALAVDARLKREGTITIEEDGSTNLTFDLDASTWFSLGGAALDPSDPAARGAILAKVLASFRLLHDDDHDGWDDEHDDHGNHPPGHP